VSGRAGRAVGRASPLELLALAAALVPFVVAVVRAAVKDWIPVGDAAYFTVRSADVLTAHHPLLGAWSSGSAVVGVAVNNLGPLQLDVLAPFTRLTPYLGTAVGTALLNAASVAAVWIAARRMFRPAVVVAVMAGTTLLVAALGLSWLIDARQQQAMMLPFYALLWLSAATWTGVGVAVPLAVVAASVTAQTHFTYGYQSGLVLAGGIVGYVVVTWTRRAAWPRVAAWSAVAAVLCWAQPLADQLAGTGNLGTALGPARDQPGAGIEAGVQIVAGAALVPPFWWPSSMRTFLWPHDGVSLAGAVIAVAVWLALAGGVALLGARTGSASTRAVGIAGAVAIVACVLAAAEIPVTLFGLVPQNYYWAWALAAFVSIALPAGLLSLPAVAMALRRGDTIARRAVLAALALIAVAVASWPRYPVASFAADEVEARRVGAPLRAQLADAIESGAIADDVEVDLSRTFFGNDYPYVMLAELQRAGIEFHFVPDSRNLDRFGESRCAEAGRYQRLFLDAGPAPQVDPGSTVLAEVTAISDAELDEYRQLQQRFGELLRDGTITIDGTALERIAATDQREQLRTVLATPGLAASGLARHLESWERWGVVSIPAAEQASFERWFALELRSWADFQTIVLEQPSAPDGRSC
jgi:hypothetical protein